MRLSLALLLVAWAASLNAAQPVNPGRNSNAIQQGELQSEVNLQGRDAQKAPVKPWELSLEDRVNVRSDPARAAERVRAEATARSGALQAQQFSQKVVDEFTGRTHPELFMPHELFRTLINLAFLMPSEHKNQVAQEMHQQDAEEVGMPADFWPRLRQIAHVYIVKSARADELGQQLRRDAKNTNGKMELALIQGDLCSIGADALEAARQEFGAERFDRFLYQSIAPHNFIVQYETLPTKDTLLWTARGCK